GVFASPAHCTYTVVVGTANRSFLKRGLPVRRAGNSVSGLGLETTPVVSLDMVTSGGTTAIQRIEALSKRAQRSETDSNESSCYRVWTWLSQYSRDAITISGPEPHLQHGSCANTSYPRSDPVFGRRVHVHDLELNHTSEPTGMVSSGAVVRRSTRSVCLPRSPTRKPFRPAVDITIKA